MEGVFTGLTFGVVLVAFFYIIKIHSAIASLDKRLRLLIEHQGIDLTQAAVASAREHLKAGDKIKAIVVYREMTGAGLAEAKTAVERLQAD